MTRIDEKLIYGSLRQYAEDNVPSCEQFFHPNDPVKTKDLDTWSLVELSWSDLPTSKNDWRGRGRLTLQISSRASKKNRYSASDIADDLSGVFAKTGVEIKNLLSQVVGWATLEEPATHSMGEDDGIRKQWWSIEFSIDPV